MQGPVRIGIIGDFEPARPSHLATNAALAHAAERLSIEPDVRWLPTPSLLDAKGLGLLETCDGLWASPGSPYRSLDGALRAIRFARERKRPFVGT